LELLLSGIQENALQCCSQTVLSTLQITWNGYSNSNSIIKHETNVDKLNNLKL